MNLAENQLKTASKYYDRFSRVYDWVSSESYYRKPREFAIKQLDLKPQQTVLNIPFGTGQNIEYLEGYLNNMGQIIGIDLSEGMLAKAKNKIQREGWTNIQLYRADATQVDKDWVNQHLEEGMQFDSILCDLGLSGFPNWEKTIDQLISLLKPNGKFVIMDWYIDKPSLRGKFIQWIGKGEVNRPLYQYMEKKVIDFELNNNFKNGDMFVASGTKPV